MRYYIQILKRRGLILWIISLILLSIYMYRYVDRKLRPTIVTISEVRARAITTETINDAIKNKLKENVDYNDLIFVKYDNEGKVTLMQANTILMNNIAAELALEVQNKLKELSKTSIKVPLRNAFDIHIVNLPSLNVKIIPQGSVVVDFATEFEASGINQTRHRIYIIVVTDIKMAAPLVSESIRITTNLPIAETIIVGDVPEQYINVPREGILDIVK
ncbi:MAG: sporulation protein YunB [Tissierellia bacterium]|nr:sporulation protein YunB [Tissierellia bacterium]